MRSLLYGFVWAVLLALGAVLGCSGLGPSGVAQDGDADSGMIATGGAPGFGGSSNGGTAGTMGGGAGHPMPLLDRGATPAYWEYQAEDADTNGTHIGPSRQFGDMAAEASQR